MFQEILERLNELENHIIIKTVPETAAKVVVISDAGTKKSELVP